MSRHLKRHRDDPTIRAWAEQNPAEKYGETVLDAWVDGDKFILEKLEQEHPIPLAVEATAGDNGKKEDTAARAAIVATDSVAEANGDDYLPGL